MDNKTIETNKLTKPFQVVESEVKIDDERYLEYRREWNDATKHLKLYPKPHHVDIEVTNACNLRCSMCERNDMKRPVGLMSYELFCSIIDQCVESDIRSVKLNLWGESLIHARFFDMIEYAHKNKVYTQFNTNTNFLNKKVSDQLIASGLDRVTFSIESVDKDIYEGTRVGNKYEKIMENVEYFIANKSVGKKPYLTIQCLRMKKNVDFIDDYVKRFKGKVDYISVTNVGSITDNPRILKESLIDYKTFPKIPCASLWQRLSVYWNGDVTVCCQDSDGFLVIGNLKDNTLIELWHGDKIDQLRRRHKNLDFEGLVCKGCTSNFKTWA